MSINLNNKVSLVTGAKQGMGRAHALALAASGAKVAVTDVNKEECDAVVEEIKKAGGDAVAFKMDVSNAEEVSRVFSEAVSHFGRLDILINNAGVFLPKPFLELTEEDWDRTLAVNLKGQFLCAQAAARHMQKTNWGRIVNISSVASGQVGVGFAGGAHYTASKGGIIGMTETMAVELASYNINVNAVAPGAIDTPMVKSAGLPEEAMKGLIMRIPKGRMGRPEEVANLIVFLSSEESEYITGSTIYIDGGWLAQ